ncbi:MAG TPA: glycosyltransferase family 2 protein [Thermoanaerobaculia bacterium]|nr:glycosyltransferase family 2 protein [Thermoanaerobaculia bacterium]
MSNQDPQIAVPSPDAGTEISVVMPCLDEAESVGICVEKALQALAAMGARGEVVIVDNGSKDGSPEIAEKAGARVIHEPRRGYGSAYLRGFAEARGRYLVMGDSDDSYDFLDIERFILPLREGRDLVMGTRLKGKILPGAMSWSHRWIGNPILSGMLKLLFRTRISDSHCGMRSFTREAYERMHLRTTGMEFASELVVNALREQLDVAEIPITYRPRIGESKLNGVRDAWRHVRFMLMFSPSYLFQLPGLILMLIGAALVGWLATGPRELFGRVWDYHVLLFGALALILGTNLVLFDVIAKTFSMGADFARPGQWLAKLPRWFSLEKGLLAGGILLLLGLGTEVKIVVDWLEAGRGPLMAVRGIALGMTAMVIGAQTLFASFLVSLMLIPRR